MGLIRMQDQSEQQKLAEACVMSNDLLKVLYGEADIELGQPQIESDGCLTFEYFKKSQALINRHWSKFAFPLMEQHDVHRRTLYAQEN